MAAPIILNASMLRNTIQCRRLQWLDFHGDGAQRSAPAASTIYRMHQGVIHEEAVQQAASPQVTPISVTDWHDAVAASRQLIHHSDADAILGVHLETELVIEGIDQPVIVRGVIDRVNRMEHTLSLLRRQSRSVYIPIEIKKYQSIDESDLVQLDCYMWLLAQAQGIEPPYGEFWLARDVLSRPARIARHDYDEARLMRYLIDAAKLASDAHAEPGVNILPHCKGCRWNRICLTDARAQFDVKVLDIRKKTHQHFQEEGITRLEQILAMTPQELTRFREIGPVSAPMIHAQARAYLENRAVIYGLLPEVCQRDPWHFDIETDPATNTIWSIGWGRMRDQLSVVVVAEHVHTVETLILPDGQMVYLAPDGDTAWRVFAEGVSVDEQPVLHWTSFDAGVMRSTAPRDVTERLNARLHDFHASFKRAVQIPARGTSLKTVAAHYGFAWSAYADWFAALRDYQHWLNSGSLEALQRACAYQLDDVRAMIVVLDALR